MATAKKHNSCLSAHCIYTIVKSDRLSEAATERRLKFMERTPWVTGQQLLLEAQEAGLEMPILFSDAAHDTQHLIYRAVLAKIEVDEESRTTTITVKNLEKLARRRPTSSPTLRNSGRKISRYDRRPYRICETPDFLK